MKDMFAGMCGRVGAGQARLALNGNIAFGHIETVAVGAGFVGFVHRGDGGLAAGQAHIGVVPVDI